MTPFCLCVGTFHIQLPAAHPLTCPSQAFHCVLCFVFILFLLSQTKCLVGVTCTRLHTVCYTTPIQSCSISLCVCSHLPVGRAVCNTAVKSSKNVKHCAVCEFSANVWGGYWWVFAPCSPVAPAAASSRGSRADVWPDRSEVVQRAVNSCCHKNIQTAINMISLPYSQSGSHFIYYWALCFGFLKPESIHHWGYTIHCYAMLFLYMPGKMHCLKFHTKCCCLKNFDLKGTMCKIMTKTAGEIAEIGRFLWVPGFNKKVHYTNILHTAKFCRQVLVNFYLWTIYCIIQHFIWHFLWKFCHRILLMWSPTHRLCCSFQFWCFSLPR